MCTGKCQQSKRVGAFYNTEQKKTVHGDYTRKDSKAPGVYRFKKRESIQDEILWGMQR